MAFDQIHLDNAILYFAKEFKKKSGKYLPQTGLYKFLSLLDFKILKNTGKPSFNLVYKAMKNGPVPIDFYFNRNNIRSELYHFKNLKDNEYDVIPKQGKNPNFDYFSSDEIEEMDRLIYIFA